MEFVKTIEDLKKNIQTLDEYIDKKCDPEYSYALGLIKRGLCFIVIEKGKEYRFYPSRFMGYIDNTMNKHQNNTTKDGRKTNPIISKILNSKAEKQKELDQAYIKYCEELGLKVNETSSFGKSRKFWKIS